VAALVLGCCRLHHVLQVASPVETRAQNQGMGVAEPLPTGLALVSLLLDSLLRCDQHAHVAVPSAPVMPEAPECEQLSLLMVCCLIAGSCCDPRFTSLSWVPG